MSQAQIAGKVVRAKAVGPREMLFAHLSQSGTALVLPDGRVCFVAVEIWAIPDGESPWVVGISHNCAWHIAKYDPRSRDITLTVNENRFMNMN